MEQSKLPAAPIFTDPDHVRETLITGPCQAVVVQGALGDRFVVLTCTAARPEIESLFQLKGGVSQLPVQHVVVSRLVFGMSQAADVARLIARAITGVESQSKAVAATASAAAPKRSI